MHHCIIRSPYLLIHYDIIIDLLPYKLQLKTLYFATYMNERKNTTSGFTLIEVILAIAIITIIATVVVVAINPTQRFQDARDAKRQTDIRMILKAVHQYRLDNRGVFPPESRLSETDAEKQLGLATDDCDIDRGGCATGTMDCMDISGELAKYLKSIPEDPSNGDAEHTYYTVAVDDYNVVTVRACVAEGEDGISVSQ